jgi:hypothetical protein
MGGRNVTTDRYHAYCCAREALGDLGLTAEERELLREAAEDLLLARGGDHELVEEARQRVAMALSVLVSSRRLTSDYADELWCLIADCGPSPSAPAPAAVGA